MKCPNCAKDMMSLTLEGQLGAILTIDLCTPCQAFWFDKFESLRLSAASTLKLLKLIGENSSQNKPLQSEVLHCPRCSDQVVLTHDLQGNTRFKYWRCNQHGRFIGFFDFLREKSFIRQLSPQQLQELRRNIQIVNCSHCGAPIDLNTNSACAHCGSAISMLDMRQPDQLLAQLKQAAEPRPINLALPLELEHAKHQVERSFARFDSSPDWWSDASSSGLVQAGLNAVIQWLAKSGL